MNVRRVVDMARTKRRLALGVGDTLAYFSPGILFFLLGCVFLSGYVLDFLRTGGFYNPTTLEIIGFVSLAMAVVIVTLRRRALEFTALPTLLPKEEQLMLFKELCEVYGIEPVVLDKDILALLSVPGSSNTGQRVTLVFDRGAVLFNSITIPSDVGVRHKSVSFGENRTNLEIFREELEGREQEYLERINKAGV